MDRNAKEAIIGSLKRADDETGKVVRLRTTRSCSERPVGQRDAGYLIDCPNRFKRSGPRRAVAINLPGDSTKEGRAAGRRVGQFFAADHVSGSIVGGRAA